MTIQIINQKLLNLDKSILEAIRIVGGYSRGEAYTYSEFDLICIPKSEVSRKDTVIEFIDGKYVVTKYVSIEQLEECFSNPDLATKNILGLKQSIIRELTNNGYINSEREIIL